MEVRHTDRRLHDQEWTLKPKCQPVSMLRKEKRTNTVLSCMVERSVQMQEAACEALEETFHTEVSYLLLFLVLWPNGW